MRTIRARYADVTKTRITFAADEVRIKFPIDGGGVRPSEALPVARALEVFLPDAVTLRGRIEPASDGGFRTTLVNTNGRKFGTYHIGVELAVTETGLS